MNQRSKQQRSNNGSPRGSPAPSNTSSCYSNSNTNRKRQLYVDSNESAWQRDFQRATDHVEDHDGGSDDEDQGQQNSFRNSAKAYMPPHLMVKVPVCHSYYNIRFLYLL